MPASVNQIHLNQCLFCFLALIIIIVVAITVIIILVLIVTFIIVLRKRQCPRYKTLIFLLHTKQASEIFQISAYKNIFGPNNINKIKYRKYSSFTVSNSLKLQARLTWLGISHYYNVQKPNCDMLRSELCVAGNHVLQTGSTGQTQISSE